MIDDRALRRAEVERYLRAGTLSRAEMSDRTGASVSTIARWEREFARTGTLSGPAASSLEPDPAASPPARAAPRRKARSKQKRNPSRSRLIRRLYGAIDRNLQQLEQRMTEDAPPTAADGERDARALGAAIRNIEKVTELEAATARDAQAGSGTAALSSEDADRLRLELAERILRLRHQRGDDSSA